MKSWILTLLTVSLSLTAFAGQKGERKKIMKQKIECENQEDSWGKAGDSLRKVLKSAATLEYDEQYYTGEMRVSKSFAKRYEHHPDFRPLFVIKDFPSDYQVISIDEKSNDFKVKFAASLDGFVHAACREEVTEIEIKGDARDLFIDFH